MNKQALSIDDVSVGAVMETTFWTNHQEGSPFRFCANHLNGKKAPKVVLCDDPRVRPGTPCMVRIKALRKPGRKDRGSIEVDLISDLDFLPEGIYLDPMVARKLEILLDSGANILLDGPQGCGKTVLARSVAESLGMEFVFFNCGAVIETMDFLATLQVKASSSGQPVTEFIKTEILIALEAATTHSRRRYLVFLDELNRSPEAARNGLMPALDSTRRIFHPISGEFMKIPDNVQFIAAVNRGQGFSATYGIDAAQLDRFAPLQMDYLPPDQEVKLLLRRHPELSEPLIEKIVGVAHAIRTSEDVSQGLSVRATDEVCIYLKHPLMENDQTEFLPEVLRSSFCGRFMGVHQDVHSEAGMVWGIIQQRLSGKKKTSPKKNKNELIEL